MFSLSKTCRSRSALTTTAWLSRRPALLPIRANPISSSSSAAAPSILPRSRTALLSELARSRRPTSTPQFFKPNFPRNYAKDAKDVAAKTTTAVEAPSKQPRFLDRMHAQVTSDLQAAPSMTAFERLWRPFVFTAVATGGALYYGYVWRPQPQSERWFATVPQSFAVVTSLMAVNAAVFVLWKIPLPATWRLLNRYALTVTALPHSFSLLGSTFSHQSLMHLATNMFALYVFGTTLCEQIGPGWFLSLYLSGGVISGFSSLALNVLTRRLHCTSLGASGAILSVVGCYTYFNPDVKLQVVFLPFIQGEAQYFAAAMAAFEVLGILRGWLRLDHMAHLSGLLWGVAFGKLLDWEVKRRVNERRRKYRWQS